MTTFKSGGNRTGFNRTGSNKAVPNNGAPTTKFKGRGGFPEGPLKHYPAGAGEISDGNRRLAKSNVGDGGKGSTVFRGRTSYHK